MAAMAAVGVFWLPLLALADELVMLQLSKSPSADVLCSCGDHCPTMAAAKNFLVNSCIEDSKQDVLCTEGADAAFAGHALDGTFDVAICSVLQRIFSQLGFLGNSSGSSTGIFGSGGIFGSELEQSLWRERRRDGARKSRAGGSRHYSTGMEVANDTDTEGLNIGTVIITHGNANNISVSNDHSADSSSGNRGNTVETGSNNEVPFNNGNRVSVGSDNTIPIGSGNVIPIGSGNVIPIGSGNVIPVGSGNVVVVPVGSGNDVSVPVGTGNQVIVPVGSGNQVIVPVGSGNAVVIPVGNNNTINIVSASNTSSNVSA